MFWHTDGSPIPVEYTSTPILKDGKPSGAVVVFRDISQRKEIERQREDAYAEIKQLTEELERYLETQFGMKAAEYPKWLRTKLTRSLYRQYVVRYAALCEDRGGARFQLLPV